MRADKRPPNDPWPAFAAFVAALLGVVRRQRARTPSQQRFEIRKGGQAGPGRGV